MMKKINQHKPIIKQQGAVVLFTSIILLIGVTLITIFAARVGVMDQRISANEYRHKEAYATAETGLEQAHAYIRYRVKQDKSFFNLNDMISCGGATSFPCGDGTSNIYSHYFDGNAGTPGEQPLEQITSLSNGAKFDAYIVYDSASEYITVLSQGSSVDGTGGTVLQQKYGKVQLLTQGPVPPIMSPVGTLTGNFRIVPNPNGNKGAEDKFGNKKSGGFPISLWVNTLTLSGAGASFKTCYQEYYRSGNGDIDGDICDTYPNETDWEGAHCDCYDPTGGSATPAEIDSILSGKDGGTLHVDRDIVTGGDYPDSVVKYAFGVDDVTNLISRSQVIGDCSDSTLSGLDLTNGSYVYIDGDCSLSSNQLGSKAYPIILIVNGEFTISGHDKHLWGMVYSSGDVNVSGTPTVHGALLSESSIDIGAGTYNQVYDEGVFNSLRSSELNSTTGPIQYSKTDTQ